MIACRGTEHGSGLGVHRWVMEQSIALLHWFRRLRIRWEIRDDIHEAFLRHEVGHSRDPARRADDQRPVAAIRAIIADVRIHGWPRIRRRPHGRVGGVSSHGDAVLQEHDPVAEPALLHQFKVQPDLVGQELFAPAYDDR